MMTTSAAPLLPDPENGAERKTAYATQWLPVATLKVDHEYQRPLSPGWLAPRTWEPVIAHALRVNRRTDGTYWVVDGQHRLALAQKANVQEIRCDVFRFDTVADEAHHFRIWNSDNRKPRAGSVFKSAVVEGDPVAVDIVQIVELAGFEMDYRERASKRPLHIDAVETLLRLHRGYDLPGRRGGPDRLRLVLRIIKTAWPHAVGANSGVMLDAIAEMLRRYGTRLDESRFIAVLSGRDPLALVRKARADNLGTAGTEHGSVKNRLVLEFHDLYNKGLHNKGSRGNRLPHPFYGGDEEPTAGN